MKNLFVLAVIGAAIISCNTNPGTTTTTNADTSTHAAYAPSEGDVTYRDGKLMVRRNGEWEVADNDVHLSNGIVVNKKGEAVKEDKVVVLHDGEVVDKSGRFFDKAGNAIGDAWDATKKGVKKAGEEVKDLFDGNNKDDKKVKYKDK